MVRRFRDKQEERRSLNTMESRVLFRAPARLALTLHANRARVQLNRALAHLFQAGQGRLIEPRPGTVRSTHTSQTNRALVVKRTRARFKLASVSTPLMLQQIHNLFDTNNDNLTAVRECFPDN